MHPSKHYFLRYVQFFSSFSLLLQTITKSFQHTSLYLSSLRYFTESLQDLECIEACKGENSSGLK